MRSKILDSNRQPTVSRSDGSESRTRIGLVQAGENQLFAGGRDSGARSSGSKLLSTLLYSRARSWARGAFGAVKEVHPAGFEPATFGSVVMRCVAARFQLPTNNVKTQHGRKAEPAYNVSLKDKVGYSFRYVPSFRDIAARTVHPKTGVFHRLPRSVLERRKRNGDVITKKQRQAAIADLVRVLEELAQRIKAFEAVARPADYSLSIDRALIWLNPINPPLCEAWEIVQELDSPDRHAARKGMPFTDAFGGLDDEQRGMELVQEILTDCNAPVIAGAVSDVWAGWPGTKRARKGSMPPLPRLGHIPQKIETAIALLIGKQNSESPKLSRPPKPRDDTLKDAIEYLRKHPPTGRELPERIRTFCREKDITGHKRIESLIRQCRNYAQEWKPVARK